MIDPFNSDIVRDLFGKEVLLSPDDIKALTQIANECSTVEGDYFEIGSNIGHSASVIVSQIFATEKHLYCFDHFESGKLHTFCHMMALLGFDGKITCIRGNFMHQGLTLKKRFAFGFIDHDHRLDTTIAAYEMFWPAINSGGCLAFHDYGHPDYPEPKAFLDSIPHKRRQFGPILVFQKE